MTGHSVFGWTRIIAAATALLGLIAVALMFAPPTLEANSPPAAPTGLAAAAGDGSVTLSWDLATDNVTGYEYNVNHNDTSTGNLSGWSQWAAVPGSGASTTSYTFTGLTNGREYRYHLRAVNANGESVGAPASGPPWFVVATPNAPAGRAHRPGRRRRRPQRHPDLEQPRRLLHHRLRVQRQPQRHRHRQLHRLDAPGTAVPDSDARPPRRLLSTTWPAGGSTATTCGR